MHSAAIFQVPTDLGVRKPYVDWDMKLSTLEEARFFDAISPGDVEHCTDPADYLWKVQVVRKIALCTPRVLCEILASMKCFSYQDHAIHVLVKEGTRRLGGGEKGDWKISFHFVIQATVLHFQFKCLYEMITSFIADCASTPCASSPECSMDVAHLLDLVGEQEYEEFFRKQKRARTGADPADTSTMSFKKQALRRAAQGGWGMVLLQERGTAAGINLSPLGGMDLHLMRTEFQGLACLGSKKEGAERGNRLLGMMSVTLRPSAPKSWHWDDGYCQRTHPLLVLAEASMIMPGPRCIGLAPMELWEPMVSDARRRAVDTDAAWKRRHSSHPCDKV
jgi:hypothetical protein